MKICAQTMDILKSFSAINMSIAVSSGNVIRTISPQGTLMAEAQCDETFSAPFAIYDLSQFIALCNMGDQLDFSFGHNRK